jgi:hypothetical protein
VLAVSCLVLGFVGGWSLATVGGDDVKLPDANVDVTVEKPAPRTETVAPARGETPPERAQVTVAVLNGTGTAGLAAQTATQLKELGYAKVTTGNTPARTGPSVVYFRDGAKAAADRLAKDLKLESALPIEGTPLETAEGQLVLVLGPG